MGAKTEIAKASLQLGSIATLLTYFKTDYDMYLLTGDFYKGWPYPWVVKEYYGLQTTTYGSIRHYSHNLDVIGLVFDVLFWSVGIYAVVWSVFSALYFVKYRNN